MSDNLKSFVFAGVLCLVCSILLTAASTGLKEFQQKNIALDMQKNILMSVGLISDDRKYSSEHIEKIYNDSIKSLWTGDDGKIVPEKKRSSEGLPVYVHVREDEIESYIIPIEARGLWGKINGYLSLENDGSTIKGFTVYKHSETPGLGGEIEKRWFQKNFEGKKIVDQGGDFVSVSVAKGAVKDISPKEKQEHFVDGISGATLTGKFLSAGLKEILLEYEPVSVRFRKGGR
ncbi:MAG: FMN-binding protein [Desulfobacteraceae bacterium]|nr:FMN-binding protein [Desulfobacteraceae bacterium]